MTEELKTESEKNDVTSSMTTSISRHRYFLTFCLYSCFISLGFVESLTGPTLVHLSLLYSTDVAGISLRFSIGSIGYLLGAFLCGVLFDKLNRELLFVAALSLLGIATYAIPLLPSLALFFVCHFCLNMTSSFLDAACQPYIINLWARHKYRDPITQGLHAVYTIGAILGPMIAAPFLVDLQPHLTAVTGMKNESAIVNNSKTLVSSLNTTTAATTTDAASLPLLSSGTTSTADDVTVFYKSVDTSYDSAAARLAAFDDSSSIVNLQDSDRLVTVVPILIDIGSQDYWSATKPPVATKSDHVKFLANDVTDVRYVFAIIGLFVCAVALLFVGAYACVRSSSEKQEEEEKGEEITHRKLSCDVQRNRMRKRVLLIFLFFFVLFYYWCEETPANFLSAYAIGAHGWSAHTATYLMSVFWLFHGLGLLFGVVLSFFVKPHVQLIANIILTVFSFIILFIANQSHLDMLLWTSASLTALATASTFPSSMLWMSSFLDIDGKVGGILMGGISLGSIIGSTFTSNAMTRLSYDWLAYSCLFAACMDALLLAALWKMVAFAKPTLKDVKDEATSRLTT